MTKQHTPGPWQEDDCRDAYGFTTIRRADGTVHGDTESQPIATVYSDSDCAVIAAAPDLLAFARMVAAGNTEIIELERRARNLVTKAGG